MSDSLFRMNRLLLAGVASTLALVLGGLCVFGDQFAFGASTPKCTINGTPGNDVINGTSRADVLCGLGGDDTINGGTGNDTILGGDGNDVLNGGAGNDTIDGGAGSDTVSFSDSTAAITANLATGKATGAGKDSLSGFENLTGGSGNDGLTGDSSSNIISGGLGDDSVVGVSGNDLIDGGPGADTASGGPGADGMVGGPGRDSLNGGTGNDLCDKDRSDRMVSSCRFDSTSPVIRSFSLSSTRVDTSTGSATIHVTARITDDLSGTSFVIFYLRAANGNAVNSVLSRTSGDTRDGTFEGDFVIPTGKPSGKWTLDANATDASGNDAYIGSTDGSDILDNGGHRIGPGSIQNG